MKERILIAVSGGPDSMALLHYCYKHEYKISGIIHINYNYRNSSLRDKRIVRQVCHKYHLKLYVKNIDKRIYTQNRIKNFEAWARKVRYDYFSFISKITNTKKIYIAHHKDDFIETAIRQIRKHHDRYFYGIKSNNNYGNLKVFRPFLHKYWKDDILAYCAKNKIMYGIDETNYQIKYERNYIRWILEQKNKEKNIIYQSLCSINKDKKHLYKRHLFLFKKWSKNNFSLEFWNDCYKSDEYGLIKLYLYVNKINNISQKKILGVWSFLKNNLNNKIYRIESNRFIKKDKKYLKLC